MNSLPLELELSVERLRRHLEVKKRLFETGKYTEIVQDNALIHRANVVKEQVNKKKDRVTTKS